MTMRRCYETQIDEHRKVVVGYDPENDDYLIVGKNADFEKRICLSQDAMFAVMQSYAALLRYQSQIGMAGIGGEL